MNEVTLSQPSSASDSGKISPFLTLTATGLDRSSSATSKEAQLAFWFSIPEGDLWGAPSWGHPFRARQFMTGSSNEIVAAEMQVVRKLRQDIPSLKISGISAEFQGSDLIIFTILYVDNGLQATFKGSAS